MAQTAYVATIQVCITGVNSEAEACDFLSETLRPMPHVLDWAYLQVGGQFLSPALRVVPDDYQEGDFIS